MLRPLREVTVPLMPASHLQRRDLPTMQVTFLPPDIIPAPPPRITSAPPPRPPPPTPPPDPPSPIKRRIRANNSTKANALRLWFTPSIQSPDGALRCPTVNEVSSMTGTPTSTLSDWKLHKDDILNGKNTAKRNRRSGPSCWWPELEKNTVRGVFGAGKGRGARSKRLV